MRSATDALVRLGPCSSSALRHAMCSAWRTCGSSGGSPVTGASGSQRYYAHSSDGGEASSSGRDTQQQRHGEQRNRVLGSLLREAQVAEASMSKFFKAQQLVLRGRPDAAYFAEREQQQLAAVQELMPRYRTRPSLLLAAAKAAGTGAGVLAAAAPRPLRDAVVGGLQDALTEVYNEQLAELRQQGLSDQEPVVRRLLLALRDLERAPEGAPQPPDVLALQRAERLADVGVQGLVGAAAKVAALAILGASKRL